MYTHMLCVSSVTGTERVHARYLVRWPTFCTFYTLEHGVMPQLFIRSELQGSENVQNNLGKPWRNVSSLADFSSWLSNLSSGLGENCCVEAILSALVRHEVHNAIDQNPAIHQLNPVHLASEKVEASFQCTVAYSECAVLVVQN